MISSRHAVLTAASLLAMLAAPATLARADDQQPPGKEDNKGKHQGKQGRERPNNWQQGKPPGEPRGQQGNNFDKRQKPSFGQQQQPNNQFKPAGNGPSDNSDAFGSHKRQKQRQQPPANNAVAPQQQPEPRQQPQNAGPQNFNNKFGDQNNWQDKGKRQGKRDWKNNAPAMPPPNQNAGSPQKNFAPTNTGQGNNFVRPAQPLPAADAKRRFEALRGQRKEVKIDGGKGVIIEEPGKRRIIRDNNRVFIQHDDNERLRRVAPNARFEKGKGGINIAVIDRPGGYRIYSETDSHGQLIRRYRRGPDGRDVIIIDNRRRHRDNFGRNLAAGIGIGVGVVAGAAILNSMLDVPPPRITIPRDEYIVDYERASDEDVYDALSAPPVEDFRDRYTLDEIRATAALRDRMRRVDLDDITFDFGSWEVNPGEYRKLDRIARAMRRIINRNPDEVFMIEGYTDAVGSREDNLSLSDRRAESVAEVLTDQFGVPFENLTTQGYGEDYLKVPTQEPERLNRRVAVRRITPLLARGNNPPPPPSGSDRRQYDDGPDQSDDGRYDDDQGYDGPPPR